MVTYLYRDKETYPFQKNRIREIEDTAEAWREVLLNQDGTPKLAVVNEAGKVNAAIIIGAEYADEAPAKDEFYIVRCHSLILDVDDWGSRPAYSLETLQERLGDLCYVAFSTWQSTRESPRWRVVVPLAAPIPASKVRSLVRNVILHPDALGPVVLESTINPNRLGFVGVTISEKSKQDFQWHFNQGTKLEWRDFANILVDEYPKQKRKESDAGFPARPKYEISKEVAIKAAVREYESRFSGKIKNSGRSTELFKTSCLLWWDWAAEDEDFVRQCLIQLNDKCLEPEDYEEVEKSVHRGRSRVEGPASSQQHEDYGRKRVPRNVISKDGILTYAKRLNDRRSDESKRGSYLLKHVVKGEALSDDSATWRTDTFKAAAHLAEGFSQDSAERIVSFLTPSLAVMRARNEVEVPSEEDVIQYVHRKAHLAIRRMEEREAEKKDELRQNISFAFFGKRDTPYTKHELRDFEKTVGLCDHSWILLSKNSYYVFVNGGYIGPKNDKEMQMDLHKWLSPAHEVLKLHTLQTDRTGAVSPREKTVEELCKEYGCSVETEIDIRLESAYFKEDNNQRSLVLCGPIKNDFEPKFRKDVDAWLREFFDAEDYELVCDWLSLFDDLTHPLAGLYIKGPASTGKGVFVQGCAKLWQGGTIKYQHLLGQFNGLLERTPVVWADENISKSVQGSSDVREFITRNEWDLNKKQKDHVNLKGYLRFLFTANNFNMFSNFKDSPDPDDLDAFAARLVSVTVRREAKDFFKADENSTLYKAIVEEGALAEHILWLKEQRRARVRARGARCGVMMGDRNRNGVIARFQVTSPVCDYICNFIIDALLAGRKAKAALGKHTVVHKGKVLVRTEPLISGMIIQDQRMPFKKAEISRNVALLANKQRTKFIEGGDNYYQIDKSLLEAWVENTSYAEWEDIEEAIRHLDIKKPVSVVSNNPHIDSDVSAAELSVVDSTVDGLEGAAS